MSGNLKTSLCPPRQQATQESSEILDVGWIVRAQLTIMRLSQVTGVKLLLLISLFFKTNQNWAHNETFQSRSVSQNEIVSWSYTWITTFKLFAVDCKIVQQTWLLRQVLAAHRQE